MKYLFIFLFAASADAATLECRSLVNLNEVSSGSVTPVKNVKKQVSESDEVISFVTETGPEHYLVEAYLPSLQMRVYAEGKLHAAGETLTASAWDRSLMVDVVCKKLSK